MPSRRALLATLGGVGVARVGVTAADDPTAGGVAWLFALDGDGRRRWERTLPQPHWDWHHGIRRVGSEYVLCGTRGTTGDTDDRVAWLVWVGADGTVRDRFHGPRGTRGHAVAPAAGRVVVGGDFDREDGGHPPWLARVGGEPGPPGGPFREVTPPTLPGWVLPFVAGGVTGVIGTLLLGDRRDRR